MIYYWIRICDQFNLPIEQVFNESLVLPSRFNNNITIQETLLHVSKNTGLVSDILKKNIRDNKLNKDSLSNKLSNLMAHLLKLIEENNFDFLEIINMNVEKIEERRSKK